MYYYNIIVGFLCKYSLGPGNYLKAQAPSLSYGVRGRVSSTYMKYVNPEEKEIFPDKQRDYKAAIANKRYVRPFNFGAGLTVGYEFNVGILTSGNYNLGLTDV